MNIFKRLVHELSKASPKQLEKIARKANLSTTQVLHEIKNYLGKSRLAITKEFSRRNLTDKELESLAKFLEKRFKFMEHLKL